MSLIPAPIVLTDAGNMKECMNNMYLKTQGILNDTTTTNLSLNEGMQLSNNSTSSTFIQSSSGELTISNTIGGISINPTTSFQVSSAGNVDISSGLGGVQISSPNDYINFICPNSTYFNLTTELTGDGNIYCQNIINPTSITCQTPLINQTDSITPNFISMDLKTYDNQNPVITLTKNIDIIGTLTEMDSGMEIFTKQNLNVIGEKQTIIQSQNDIISLYVPSSSKVFVDKSSVGTGDGDIYASNFYGNASSASFASNASYASNAGSAVIATTATNADNATLATTATNANYVRCQNTTANLTHFVPFVDNTASTYKQPQTNSSFTFNPNTLTLSATTFVGSLSGNASTSNSATNSSNVNTIVDNTTASNCPVAFYTNSSGFQTPKLNTAGLYYRPNVNILNCNFEGSLTGTATNANAINLTSDNTAGLYYIPFSKLAGGSARQLYIDDTTGPLTYNPTSSSLSCSVLNASTINGNLANATSVASNSSGALSISSGSASSMTINSINGTINLQSNGTNIAIVQSTGLQLTQINFPSANLSFYNGSFNPLVINGTTGLSTFTNINTTGLTLPATNTTATFTAGILTIPCSTFKSYMNFSIGLTGITNTISVISLTNAVVNGEYYVAIYNGGSGNLTINATSLGVGVKSTYTSAVVVPTTGSAIMKINYLSYTTGGNIYVVSVNLVA